jgi:hypothetical protein
VGAAAAGNGERSMGSEEMVSGHGCSSPNMTVGLGRLEDQESAGGARGGGTRKGLVAVQTTNVIRVRIKVCSTAQTDRELPSNQCARSQSPEVVDRSQDKKLLQWRWY